jgi:hypothetical protein
LVLRGTREQGSGEDYITRSFVLCKVKVKLSPYRPGETLGVPGA